MKHVKYLRRIIISALAAVFLFSAGMVARYAIRSHSEQEAFEQLASIPDTVATEENLLPSGANGAEEKHISPYLPLKQQNEDFWGWLSIEGTVINYPVMHTPDDPEYYLHRAFDKSDSRSGVPFLDAACFPECGNYLIYGHHMSNGTMFADLLSYTDQEFWKEHPNIYLDTLESAGSYSILAVFYSEIYPEGVEGFRYYLYTDVRDPQDFDSYIHQVKEAALYDTGVTAEYGDRLLTLSTCSYHTENGRFVVVARQRP